MIRKFSLIALGSVFLSGCFNVQTSQAPIATTYPISEQQKMQAAHHWDVLAQHQAQQLLKDPAILANALYIDAGEHTSPFTEAFSSLLTSQLVSGGASVNTTSNNALTVRYRVQVVEHKDRGRIRPPQGALTALAVGIAVATIPYNNWSEPSLALIPAAAAADLFSGSWTSSSNQEVIITTQVVGGERIVYSSSSIYYINAGDNDHYKVDKPAKTIKMTETW